MDETLEEAGEKLYPNRESFLYRFQNIERLAFTEGAKWQQERMYRKKDMEESFYQGWVLSGAGVSFKDALKKWFDECELKKK